MGSAWDYIIAVLDDGAAISVQLTEQQPEGRSDGMITD
jgi:hypothetical protein